MIDKKEMNKEVDWEYLESLDKNGKVENKQINKKNDNDRILSHKKYAQELYNIISSDNKFVEIKPIPEVGNVVKGKITKITEKEANIDIGYREHAILYTSKERPDYISYLQPGVELNFVIIDDGSKNDGVTVSFTKAMSYQKESIIREHVDDTTTAFKAYTKELVNGGYVVDIDGVEGFMPGSLAAINKLNDFYSLLNTYVYVIPVTNYSQDDLLIVSREEYLKTLIPSKLEELNKLNWNKNWVTGHITGTTKFGVFVEFWDCLTGMIYHTDLTEDNIEKHNKRLLKAGDPISFRIKEIINDYKIILTQLQPSNWGNDFEEGGVYQGEVVFERKIGCFVKLYEDVIGLIHVSNFKNGKNPYKIGDKINVKIENINTNNKQMDLKPMNK